MLSISRTKELIEDGSLSDQEAEQIRDVVRGFAELIFQNRKEEWDSAKTKPHDNTYETKNLVQKESKFTQGT